MILGSLLLKRKETAVHGFVRRSFFIKWDTGASADAPVSRKRKNHSAGYAHSVRGGHLKSFCATKKAAARNQCAAAFCYPVMYAVRVKLRRQWWKQPQKKQPQKKQPQRKQPRKMQPQRKRPRWKQPQKKQPRKQRWCLRKQPQRWRKQQR